MVFASLVISRRPQPGQHQAPRFSTKIVSSFCGVCKDFRLRVLFLIEVPSQKDI